ncbi:MAG: precorrin-6A reductase [Bacteroidota bacterium]|nr:precorrin-6A reductase [Bacteroidota bacterium]
MLWIIGGTINAREIAALLVQKGMDVLLTTTTPLGSELAQMPGLEVCCGALDSEAMVSLIREKKISTILDASHPFATEVSTNAMQVAIETGTRYLRFERKSEEYDGVQYFQSYEEMLQYLQIKEGNVLLTIGSKHVGVFSSLGNERLFARVLPVASSIEQCQAAGISAKHIIGIGGVCSEELNLAIMREYSIRYLVTKDSGDEGGIPEKLAAARSLDVEVLMLQRPKLDYPEMVSSYEEVIDRIVIK